MLNIESERLRFERWHHTHFGRAVHRASPAHGGTKPGLEYWGDETNAAWAAWIESRRATNATIQQGEDLPPLPRSQHSYQTDSGSDFNASWKDAYTADQMREYGAACRASKQGEDDARDAARYRWIEENCRTQGGGHGFTITCYVPVDEEDMGCGIDAARASQSGTDK